MQSQNHDSTDDKEIQDFLAELQKIPFETRENRMEKISKKLLHAELYSSEILIKIGASFLINSFSGLKNNFSSQRNIFSNRLLNDLGILFMRSFKDQNLKLSDDLKRNLHFIINYSQSTQSDSRCTREHFFESKSPMEALTFLPEPPEDFEKYILDILYLNLDTSCYKIPNETSNRYFTKYLILFHALELIDSRKYSISDHTTPDQIESFPETCINFLNHENDTILARQFILKRLYSQSPMPDKKLTVLNGKIQFSDFSVNDDSDDEEDIEDINVHTDVTAEEREKRQLSYYLFFLIENELQNNLESQSPLSIEESKQKTLTDAHKRGLINKNQYALATEIFLTTIEGQSNSPRFSF